MDMHELLVPFFHFLPTTPSSTVLAFSSSVTCRTSNSIRYLHEVRAVQSTEKVDCFESIRLSNGRHARLSSDFKVEQKLSTLTYSLC